MDFVFWLHSFFVSWYVDRWRSSLVNIFVYVGSAYKTKVIWVKKHESVFWWSLGSFEICHILVTNILSFIFQSSNIYHLLYLVYFEIYFVCVGVRKTSWIKWDIIYLNKEKGGMRVRRIGEFHMVMVMLGKCCWLMHVEHRTLWFKVLAARYGEETGHVKKGGWGPS